MFLKGTSVNKGVKSAAYAVLMKAREKVGKMQTACSHQIPLILIGYWKYGETCFRG